MSLKILKNHVHSKFWTMNYAILKLWYTVKEILRQNGFHGIFTYWFRNPWMNEILNLISKSIFELKENPNADTEMG